MKRYKYGLLAVLVGVLTFFWNFFGVNPSASNPAVDTYGRAISPAPGWIESTSWRGWGWTIVDVIIFIVALCIIVFLARKQKLN